MRKVCSFLLALLLVGCSGQPETFVGFNISGKTYSSSGAELKVTDDKLTLTSQSEEVAFELSIAGKPQIGKTIDISSGQIVIGSAKHTIESGQFTLQTLDTSLARGNFDLVSGGQTVVGSFDAHPR